MHPRMRDRLARLEAQRAAKAEQVPPGMASVLMYAIAVRVGGYPRPQDLGPPYHHDGISNGLARGLGYHDFADMERQADQDINAWGARMEEGVAALLRTEGIERDQPSDVEVFGGLVRILDDAELELGGRRPGWEDIGERLDDLIRFCGLIPEAVRAISRA